MCYLESKIRQESQRLLSNFGPEENRRLNPWSRALCRVAAGVPLGERKAPENAWKFTYSEGVGRNRFGKPERTRRRTELSLRLTLLHSLFLSCSPCFGMAWFHAKRCFHGAVISFSQRTYNPLPLTPHSSRPLVGSSSVLSLSNSARARACPCSPVPLVSYPSRKFALNVQFHLHRPHPSTVSCPLPKHRFTGDVGRDALFRINLPSDRIFLDSIVWNVSINPELFNSAVSDLNCFPRENLRQSM